MPSRSASQQGRLNLVQGLFFGTPLGTRLLKSAISHVLLDLLSTPMGVLTRCGKKEPPSYDRQPLVLLGAAAGSSASCGLSQMRGAPPSVRSDPRPWGRKNDGNSVSPVVVPANSPAEIQPRRMPPTLLTHPPLSCSGFLPSTPSFRLSSSLPPSLRIRDPSTAEESGPTEFASTI